MYYPRLGRAGPLSGTDGLEEIACCRGVQSIFYEFDALNICKSSSCCAGLNEYRYFSQESGVGINLCLNQVRLTLISKITTIFVMD